MEVIVKAYESVLSKKILESQAALKNEQAEVAKPHNAKKSAERIKMEADKEAIRLKLGEDLFDGIYQFLLHHRSQSQTDEGQLF